MAKIHPDFKLAKSLCDVAELEIIQASLTDGLPHWSREQLELWQQRARSMRDQWRDLSRRQKRQAQRTQKHRQNLDTTRSHDKAALFERALSRFETALRETQDTNVSGDAHKKLPRVERKTVHRAVRSATKAKLKSKQRELNQTAAKEAPAAEIPTQGSNLVKPIADAALPTANRSLSPKSKPPSQAKKEKKGTADSGIVQTPEMTKARKRMLARQESIAFQHQKDMEARKETKKDHTTSVARPGEVNRKNTNVKEKAHRNRIAMAGNQKIRAHLTASNRRAQARRDAK